MTNQDLISVIVPVYKVEEYIDRCVASLLKQTYQNLEIILVDDGSPDNCPAICDAYAKQDGRIKVIHKENGGLSDARNVAIDVARGKYLGFVDSDDYIQEDMYEKLICAAKESEADIVVCGHYIERGNKLTIEEAPRDEVQILSGREAQLLLLQDKAMKNYAWNKLYDKKVFDGIRYPYRRNFEDVATTYLLFNKANKVCWIPDILYFYQMRDDSISSRNSSDEKWYGNCKDIVKAHQERCEFYSRLKDKELLDWAVAQMLPYIYTTIRFSHRVGKEEESVTYKDLLKKYKQLIIQNPLISEKDKKVYSVYAGSVKLCANFLKYQKYGRKAALAKKYVKKTLKKVTSPLKRLHWDFSLEQGKEIRLIYFELPCFDNLGDHAIAYASRVYLEEFVWRNPKYQLFVIDSWKTTDAILALKKQISARDIVFCQGGGNMGSLYKFAEDFRNKVLRSFAKNRIIIFPQTIYLSEDEAGRKTAAIMKKVYGRCTDLTIFARDHRSAEIMRAMFNNHIVEMTDIVASLDKMPRDSVDKHSIMLCLRSDKESALDTEQKKWLYHLAKENSDIVTVTDTIATHELSMEERAEALEKKWEVFSKAKVVITDRLHGMIFSLITGTPCVVLGNNHHKVYETYRTLSKCEYLYYCSAVEEVETILPQVLSKPQPLKKTDFSEEYRKIEKQILR